MKSKVQVSQLEKRFGADHFADTSVVAPPPAGTAAATMPSTAPATATAAAPAPATPAPAAAPTAKK